MEHTPTEQTDTDRHTRDRAILEEYLSGDSLALIGDRYGISRERVRQVLAEFGVKGRNPADAARVRNTRLASLHHDRIVAEFERVGTIAGTAARLAGEVPGVVVRHVLEGRTETRRPRDYHRQFSDTSILNAIRRADSSGANTTAKYTVWRGTPEGHGAPSIPLVVMRFGSWAKARQYAGLNVTRQSTGNRRSFSDDDITTAVERFLSACTATGRRPSARAYDNWAATVGNVPRLSTIRIRTNRAWTSLVAKAGK